MVETAQTIRCGHPQAALGGGSATEALGMPPPRDPWEGHPPCLWMRAINDLPISQSQVESLTTLSTVGATGHFGNV